MTTDPVLSFDPIRILRQLIDASSIWQGQNFTFVTNAGFFDCLASPEEGGPTDYELLARSASPMTLAGASVLVCSLEDLIRMKQAAGRAKDLIEVEVLKAVLAATRESQ